MFALGFRGPPPFAAEGLVFEGDALDGPGVTVVASSQIDDTTFSDDHMIANDLDTTWWGSDGADSQTLVFTLAQARAVNLIRMYPYGPRFNRAPTGWALSGSNASDTGPWTLVETTTQAGSGTHQASTWKEYVFTNDTPFRYYQLVMTDKNEAFGA